MRKQIALHNFLLNHVYLSIKIGIILSKSITVNLVSELAYYIILNVFIEY